MIFWHIIIIFLSLEVFWWGKCLNDHSRMMKELGDNDCYGGPDDICFRKNWIRVFMASVMATSLSMGVILWWIVMWNSGEVKTFTYSQWVASGIQLSHIHFFAIIARCTCLDISDWPIPSQIVSKYLHKIGLFLEKNRGVRYVFIHN